MLPGTVQRKENDHVYRGCRRPPLGSSGLSFSPSVAVSRSREAAGRMAAMTWVAAVALVVATALPVSAQTLAGAELLAALRAGGYVIYFRHADTDHSRQDQRSM